MMRDNPESELPGMWEYADFIGGKTDDESDEVDIEPVRDIWGGSNNFMDFLHFKTSTRGRDLLTHTNQQQQK